MPHTIISNCNTFKYNSTFTKPHMISNLNFTRRIDSLMYKIIRKEYRVRIGIPYFYFITKHTFMTDIYTIGYPYTNKTSATDG